MIHGKEGVVIESIVEPGKLGIINRISQNGEKFFGVPNSKIIGTHVNTIIPISLRQEHIKVQENWM